MLNSELKSKLRLDRFRVIVGEQYTIDDKVYIMSGIEILYYDERVLRLCGALGGNNYGTFIYNGWTKTWTKISNY